MCKYRKIRGANVVQPKRKSLSDSLLKGFSSVPYDVLFSNEFLRDLSRLWELRDIVPDPANLPWGP